MSNVITVELEDIIITAPSSAIKVNGKSVKPPKKNTDALRAFMAANPGTCYEEPNGCQISGGAYIDLVGDLIIFNDGFISTIEIAIAMATKFIKKQQTCCWS